MYLMAVVMVSPTGKREVKLERVFLWSLIFGPFYFAYLGIWDSALVSGLLAVISGGISILIYPFFAERIIVETYKKQGWRIKE
jgi:hypothetical protein